MRLTNLRVVIKKIVLNQIPKKDTLNYIVNVSHDFPDSEQKRPATSVTVNGYSNSSLVSSKSFNSSNIVPNASHIMQNRSFASSDRLNSATPSSSGVSVLGKLLNVINSSLLEVLNFQNERPLNVHRSLTVIKIFLKF